MHLLSRLHVAEKPPAGPLALWVPTDLDPEFARSPVRIWMDAFVDACEGVEGFVWSDLLQTLDLMQQGMEEPLPRSPASVDVVWDKHVPVRLSASMETGVVPRFPEAVPSAWRVDVLRVLARVALHYREREKSTGIAPRSPCAGRTWWERAKDAHALAGDPRAPLVVEPPCAPTRRAPP